MNWYSHWQRKDAEAKELGDKLSAEVAEHQDTKHKLEAALNKLREHGEEVPA